MFTFWLDDYAQSCKTPKIGIINLASSARRAWPAFGRLRDDFILVVLKLSRTKYPQFCAFAHRRICHQHWSRPRRAYYSK